jgi:hypothetical protein
MAELCRTWWIFRVQREFLMFGHEFGQAEAKGPRKG